MKYLCVTVSLVELVYQEGYSLVSLFLSFYHLFQTFQHMAGFNQPIPGFARMSSLRI